MAAVNPVVRNPDPDRAGLERIIFIAIRIMIENLIRIGQTLNEKFWQA
jgi:hypothetical protein